MEQERFTLDQFRTAAKSVGLDLMTIERITDLLTRRPRRQALTIICNEGIHAIPKESLPGRVLAATTGNLPHTSAEELTLLVEGACAKVAQVLKHEGPFTEIYLVPSGFQVILQKLAETIFQVMGKPATTLHYDRQSGAYWPIALDLRAIVSSA